MRIRLWALVLLAPASTGCDIPREPDVPSARGGVLDLSRWDYKDQGPAVLRGEEKAARRNQVKVARRDDVETSGAQTRG